MILTKNKLKCFIYLIIEGNLSYKEDYVLNGIPFKNMHAKLRSLSLQGIHFLQTKNQEDTARLLINLSRDIVRLYNNKKIILNTNNLTSPEITKNEVIKKNNNNSDTINSMWKTIKGISDLLAIVMMNNFTFNEFFTKPKHVIIDKLSKIKYSTSNRFIGKKTATNIVNKSREHEFYIKFLSCIKGVSVNTAKIILNNFEFNKLFLLTNVDDFNNIKYNNRKISKKTLENIIVLLNS